MKIIFPTAEFEERCRKQEIVGEQFLLDAFNFWLYDNAQLRTPFPAYMHEPLIQNAFQRIMHWAFEQQPTQIDDDLLNQVFQAIIIEEGVKLVQTDDEKLTILYPDFPRLDDKTTIEGKGSYKVSRRALAERDENLYLKVYLMHDVTKQLLETEFLIAE